MFDDQSSILEIISYIQHYLLIPTLIVLIINDRSLLSQKKKKKMMPPTYLEEFINVGQKRKKKKINVNLRTRYSTYH